METREKAFNDRMETLHDKVLVMTEEFQERTRSLKGEIILLKRAIVQGTPSGCKDGTVMDDLMV